MFEFGFELVVVGYLTGVVSLLWCVVATNVPESWGDLSGLVEAVTN